MLLREGILALLVILWEHFSFIFYVSLLIDGNLPNVKFCNDLGCFCFTTCSHMIFCNQYYCTIHVCGYMQNWALLSWLIVVFFSCCILTRYITFQKYDLGTRQILNSPNKTPIDHASMKRWMASNTSPESPVDTMAIRLISLWVEIRQAFHSCLLSLVRQRCTDIIFACGGLLAVIFSTPVSISLEMC